jgi:S1-C subfamily serine protease
MPKPKLTLKNTRLQAITISIIVVGFLVLYFAISYDYNQKFSQMETQFHTELGKVQGAFNAKQNQADEERKVLEDQMLNNFKKLEQTINKETSKVKLDLESQLQGVSSKFDEKSSELDSKISSMNVQSSDFSAIIDDVIKAVVSVRTNRGSGSGVIFDSRGYILTNQHVIDGASSILIIDYEGSKYQGQIVGTSQEVDLAVIRIISDDTFATLRFANEDDLKVGSKVIAVGNPLGLSFTVTEGIISSTDRVIGGKHFIQTDVSINPGNSGGPLVNSGKKIVGINTFKISDSEGLGFAIPSQVAKNVGEQALAQS